MNAKQIRAEETGAAKRARLREFELPWFESELERYVDRVAFQSLMCGEGLLTFRFEVRLADVIVQLSQDSEHELGERVGIPIESSVEELR